MDERLNSIRHELDEIEKESKLRYHLICVIVKSINRYGKALTFHEDVANYFEKHGFAVAPYTYGEDWLISA